ncbi:hypothetical protein BDA96_02G418400 [Sorghum bicolor]|jgi:hypothetical protein|uniref:Uncharacterized protein n=2 Tax=Sorghum bicolor TaxID=4558 RepID=A0A921RVN2_SORBI|nr:uncharacterized protein LOC8073119 [Sorghum bicolor]EER99810.1 hypothetical protein SORBI_3002G398300 [Sorghum bicolor]KAG0546097.1 hypothetical protein BDA96_02G418400 [Sorghum bicolor]KAG0546098.1 hypothetical protein BDA96_02G418400 [Sorghum bicolor]|eukprot:XP_002463289.1 uncharacterized protein LOC8073119 [Sorghum bicolor]
MGLQRKILGKRTIQQVPAEEAEAVSIPQLVELRSLKLKRSHSHGSGGDDDEGPRQLSPPSAANSTGTERHLHCPPAPKKPRLVLGCSLDGFKVLRVMDLRCFLR